MSRVRIKVVVAVGLALLALAVFAVLARSPVVVAAGNGVPFERPLLVARSGSSACQAGETLPRATSAIRVALLATVGPPVQVSVLGGGHAVTSGTVGSGWYGSTVTVPVRPLRGAVGHATVCVHFGPLTGYVRLYGAPTTPAVAATSPNGRLIGRLSIAYLEPGKSWWSLAGDVVDHIALGRAGSGKWIVLPIAALALAAIGLASRALVRELE